MNLYRITQIKTTSRTKRPFSKIKIKTIFFGKNLKAQNKEHSELNDKLQFQQIERRAKGKEFK